MQVRGSSRSVTAGSQVRTLPPVPSITRSVWVVSLPGWRTTMQRIGAGLVAARPKLLKTTCVSPVAQAQLAS